MIDKIFFAIIIIIFLVGSTGNYGSMPYFLVLFTTGFFVGIRLIENKKLYLPRYFIIYLFFVISVIFTQILIGGDLTFLELFISSLLIWFLVFNMREIFDEHFLLLLVIIGSAMFVYFLIAISNGYKYLPQNLYHAVSPEVNHNHLGDLWSVILVGLLYEQSKKIRYFYVFLFLAGLAIMTISFSRSALVSFFAGSLFILYKNKDNKNINKMLKLLAPFLLVVFLYFALFKTTLFSRPYFSETVHVILKNPLGVGYGNFSQFQTETSWVHNILLEIALGGGILSIFFFVWLFKVIRQIVNSEKHILYIAIFLAILSNFLFDITYVIPTMVWLWFVSLALMVSNSDQTHTLI